MTTANMERSFWKTNPKWYRVNNEGKFELTKEAPAEAIESFKKFSTSRKNMKCPFNNLTPAE